MPLTTTDNTPRKFKSVFAPHLGREIKFGRNRPTFVHKKPHACKVMLKSLPHAPTTTNFRIAAEAVLRDVLGNDNEGDCVFAGYYHVKGVETGNAGSLFHPTLEQVNGDYSAVTGFVPGDPSTDNGADEESALGFWQKHGDCTGTKIVGSVAIDGANRQEVADSFWYFENLYFGMELPDEWISPFPEKDGVVWDVAGPANPENGHCVVAVDLDPQGRGLIIATWGLYLVLTWAAIAKYATRGTGGQLFAILTPNQLAKSMAKAPNGILWTDILAAWAQFGGSPVPAPPPPAPTPAPPAPISGPTLADAQRWATASLSKGTQGSVARASAVKTVKSDLAKRWPTT